MLTVVVAPLTFLTLFIRITDEHNAFSLNKVSLNFFWRGFFEKREGQQFHDILERKICFISNSFTQKS